MIHIALSTKCGDFSVKEVFQLAKELRFDGVEYILSLNDLWTSPKKVLEYSAFYKVPVISLHQPLSLAYYAPPVLFETLLRAGRHFSAQVYTFHLCSLLHPLQPDTFPHIFLEKARRYNIDVSFESNPATFPLTLLSPQTYQPHEFAAFCKHYNLPMTLDTSHIAKSKGDIVEFYTANSTRIPVLHLSDFDGHTQHLPLGMGDLPLTALLQALKKRCQNTTLVLELHHFPRCESPEDKIQALKTSLLFLRKFL